MNVNNKKDYIKDYEVACNNLVSLFAKKYDVSVSKDDWVANVVGGTISINDEFFLSMEEIVIMIRENVPWETFLAWWDYDMDASLLGLDTINLSSWIKGAPRLSKEQINNLKDKKRELQELVNEYKECL